MVLRYSQVMVMTIVRSTSTKMKPFISVGNQSACLASECIVNGLGQGNAIRNALPCINTRICAIRF